MRLILASQSPRRRQILSFFSFPFDQLTPDFDEESVHYQGSPAAYACEISEGKARSLSMQHPDSLILAADTIVVCEEILYGKPQDEEDNRRMLNALKGKWHVVITAVTARQGEKEKSAYEETKVLFHDLHPHEVECYVKLKNFDKAGGYAIQGKGGLIVRKIDGCYYNVMGLSLTPLSKVLKEFGLDLWEHLK
jgi:septum formation protein